MKNLEDRELEITWDDDVVTRASYHHLRASCPCATCVNEWTGERIVDPAKIDSLIKPKTVAFVGNYAVKFTWTDGHDTGIYTFPKLRELTERK